MPDSFTARGHPDGVCTDASRSRDDVSPARRIRDAYAALAYLRTLPYVDRAHVGLMGGSHGGSTTLTSMIAPEGDSDLLAKERRAGFAAAVALYPGGVASRRTWSNPGVYQPVAPLLILIGDKDDWTPAEPCRRLTEAARQAGYPVTIKIYPGAYHSFDSNYPVRYVATRVNPNAPSGRGRRRAETPPPGPTASGRSWRSSAAT
jgi:dienelactone hydrolase